MTAQVKMIRVGITTLLLNRAGTGCYGPTNYAEARVDNIEREIEKVLKSAGIDGNTEPSPRYLSPTGAEVDGAA